MLINAICTQGNELGDSEVPTIEVPIVEPHPKSQALVVVGKRKQLDYSLHPLVVGKIFRPEDIHIEQLQDLGKASSGVCLLGINDGCDELESIRERAWLNDYSLEGEFGRESHEHRIKGREVAQASFGHVTRKHIERFLSKTRMQYKRVSFEFANADLQSQEAFELARQGSPIVYNVELKTYRPPNFRLNMQVTGETDVFLRGFIHETGCSLETTACPRSLRRSRQGPFNVEHALLDKYFHLVSILKNIQMCNKIVAQSMRKDTDVVQQMRLTDLENKTLIETFQLDDQKYAEELPESEDCLRLPWGRSYD
ncbi:putative tRNA pseudouridine synthase 2 [Ditylenchus destructor]|uniref:tRNA pseudouridine synthase 2 n=1 Tax=Ditylenchus destructor TaxID=166010 RepID=A0AAD4RB58_9BILA|nr:putative tRNA pseudouridine synthase 2 [Ditylenchus destructor]